MTLGILVPLLAALGWPVIVPMLLRQLRALPGSTDPGYDEAAVRAKARALRIAIAAELAVPVLLYLILNYAVPETGAMAVFG